MPPASSGTLVEYFIRAEDNLGGIKLLPSDTLKSKLFYIVRTNDSMTVQDIQYCPNNGGRSAYEGFDVRELKELLLQYFRYSRNKLYKCRRNTDSSRRVYIQNGQGPNNGIWLSGNLTDVLKKGDKVRVKGTVEKLQRNQN